MMDHDLEILVTGHTGFIGRALAETLRRLGVNWLGVSRSTGHDLTDPAVLDRLPRARTIVHLAGRAAILDSWTDPADFFRANHDTTLHVLEHARRTGAHVLALSSYMYGIPKRLPIDESHPVACRNPYAWSKRAGELLCEAYASDFRVPVTVLRPFNIYGPHQSEIQLVPYLVAQAMAGEAISLADLQPRRDWLWIDDLVGAMQAVIARRPKDFCVYNVGFGKSFSVREVVDEVIAQLGPRRIDCRNEIRKNEIPDCVCDASRFQRAFGWRPRTSLAEGIAQVIAVKRSENS